MLLKAILAIDHHANFFRELIFQGFFHLPQITNFILCLCMPIPQEEKIFLYFPAYLFLNTTFSQQVFRNPFYSKPDVSVIPHTSVLLPRNHKIRWERNFIFKVLVISKFGRCPKCACIGQKQKDNRILSRSTRILVVIASQQNQYKDRLIQKELSNSL